MLARRHKMQEGKVFEERYIAYPDGKISKLDGTPLKKYISPYGYERVCINGKYNAPCMTA